MSEAPAILAIESVAITFVSRHGVRDYFSTDRSNVALARLRTAARIGEQVTHFARGEAELDAASVAALNCYLRTGVAMGRMRLPWDRLEAFGGSTRYGWAGFCAHLALHFR